MANYIARVELHSASWNDYERLHATMYQRGFLRTIKASDGKWYQLPTGTYVVEGSNSSLQNALSAATAAAQETGRQSWVLVADWNAATWLGLPLVS
jgi:Endoribonuclease GhoS